jgi:hypothetical protein
MNKADGHFSNAATAEVANKQPIHCRLRASPLTAHILLKGVRLLLSVKHTKKDVHATASAQGAKIG